MTPIERVVREALNHAEECARNEYSRHIYKEALRELDGKVIVPVELIHKSKVLINFHVKRGACIDIDDKLFNEGEIYAELNRAMIAQYRG